MEAAGNLSSIPVGSIPVPDIPAHEEQPRESTLVMDMSAEICEEEPPINHNPRRRRPRSLADQTDLERGNMPDDADFRRERAQDHKQWALLNIGCFMQLQAPTLSDYSLTRLSTTSLYVALGLVALILSLSVLIVHRALPPPVSEVMLAVASIILFLQSFIIAPFYLSSH